MFTVQPFDARELGNASFLVTDHDAGVAVAIDPVRDIDAYLSHAEKQNVRIVRTLDTHLHNDFVSGSRELVAEVGAEAGKLSGDLGLGSFTISPMHTPGHTPDHTSFLLLEGDRPRALFSGGAVMVGAIARTDLFGPHLATHLAMEALKTLQVRLRGLPDDIAVYATHGGGSFCGAGGDEGHETTMGRERATNPFFQITEVMPFLARVLNQHRYPDYYRDMAALNRAGAPLLGRSPRPPAKLTPDETEKLMMRGAALIDVRRGRDYDHGHISGSYSVPLDGPFSAWVGWLVRRERPIVLCGGTDRHLNEAQRQLHRIGFDNIAGALEGGMDAWTQSGRPSTSFETADVEDMAEWILSAEPMTVVDTRDDHEWVAGHVPGALHIYVPDVAHRAAEISADAPIAVHCGSGYRAGIAASLLEQAGLKRIIHVNSEYSDWDRLHLAETVPA